MSLQYSGICTGNLEFRPGFVVTNERGYRDKQQKNIKAPD